MTSNNAAADFASCAELILSEDANAVRHIDAGEADAFMRAVEDAEKVFCVGVGRVALSLSAMVKRLNHLDIDAFMVGDLSEPHAGERDLLVVGSGSGESVIPVAIARVAKTKGVKIAYVGSNPDSSVGKMANLVVRIPVKTKLNRPDEIPSGQIMSSLFEQTLLLFADAVALSIARRKELDLASLWRRHANLE